MGVEELPVQIEFGGGTVSGIILKINPTGMLVELDRIPFSVGGSVKVLFTIKDQSLSCEARPIKTYDNYRKKVRVDSEEGTRVEERVLKLSELHFVRPSEEIRSAIMRHLMDLQVDALKKTR